MAAMFGLNIQATKIEEYKENNGVLCLKTSSETIDLTHGFDLRLMRLSHGETVQYFICGESETNKYHNIPGKGMFEFVLMNGESITLFSAFSYVNQLGEHSYKPTAYYPITQDQLEQLKIGIKSIKVELLSYDKKTDTVTSEIQEAVYKKDKIGKKIAEMEDVIEEKIGDMTKGN